MRPNRSTFTGSSGRRPVRGFTLVELLATLSVIFLIVGIALVAFNRAQNSARSAADRAAVNSLKLAVDQFKTEFGFFPPLVKDDGGVDNQFPIQPLSGDGGRNAGALKPVVFTGATTDQNVLRGRDDSRVRYSVLTLPYYIIGALDAAVDGVDGAGFVEVRRSGSFATFAYVEQDGSAVGSEDISRSGRKEYEPFFDLGRGGVELYASPMGRYRVLAASGDSIERQLISTRFELRDRQGVPIRYYRWIADERSLQQVFAEDMLDDISGYMDAEDAGGLGGEPGYYNVPPLVLDSFQDEDAPAGSFEFPVELRSAAYAIVAAGPNALFGDEGAINGISAADAIANDDSLRRRYAVELDLSEARLEDDPEYRDEAVRQARADNIVEVGS